jgi:Arc/MetJ family transcription regulator
MSATAEAAPVAREAHDDPREHAARVERLLADVRAMVSPVAWPRIEELVARLVALYGAALGRVLVLVAESGGIDAQLRARLCGDELVAGLLALHGIHPTPTAERVRQAATRVRERIGAGAGEIDSELDERGVARLHLTGDWHGPISRATVDEALRRAVEDAAPELSGVEIDGIDWTPPAAQVLVQLDLGRSRARPAEKPAP